MVANTKNFLDCVHCYEDEGIEYIQAAQQYRCSSCYCHWSELAVEGTHYFPNGQVDIIIGGHCVPLAKTKEEPMLVSIEGDTSTAKTTFALTAPLPIVCFAFDIGFDYAIKGLKFKEYFEGLSIHTEKYNRIGENKVDEAYHQNLWHNNDITIYELPTPIQLDSNTVSGYIALWQYFISLLGLAASDSVVSSIVLDTATIVRTVAVNKYLEELNQRGERGRKQLLQIEYGVPNGAIENIYSTMAVVGKVFIATHHMRDEYKDQNVGGKIESVTTGKLELDGWNKTHRFVDVAIETTKDKGNFKAKYVKCRLNPKLEGGEIIGEPNWDNLVEHIEMTLEGRVKFPRR